MKKLKQMWNNTDSIEIALIASLAFCLGWGTIYTILELIKRFYCNC